jgi:hypothetical protein
MNIGFTGTRKGMSLRQKEQLRDIFYIITARAEAFDYRHSFHHGGAEGADTEAAAAARRHYCNVIEHPITDTKGLLDRNHDIVAACDILIAAPETDTEQLRSGTWATIRYCRAAGKPVIMLSRGKVEPGVFD